MELIATIQSWLKPVKWIIAIRRYRRRPRLNMYFSAQDSYHKVLVANLGNTPGFFCHVMVANEGKEVAEGCTARILEIAVPQATGGYAPHPSFRAPMDLKWAHQLEFAEKDIEPGVPERLDLCFGLEARPEHLFFHPKRVPSGITYQFPAGKYKVHIRVRAKNINPVNKSFIVSHPGRWDEIRVDEFNS